MAVLLIFTVCAFTVAMIQGNVWDQFSLFMDETHGYWKLKTEKYLTVYRQSYTGKYIKLNLFLKNH